MANKKGHKRHIPRSQRDNPNIDQNYDGNYIDTKIVKTHEARSRALAKFKNGVDMDADTREWIQLYVADYKIMGYSSTEIKKFMERDFQTSVSTLTILNWAKKVFDQWAKSNEESITRRRALEISKIDKLETKYWEAFYESKKNKEGIVIENEEIPGKNGRYKKGTKRTKTKQGSYAGDGQFLKGIEWCIEMRCKLFGLSKDVIDVNMNDAPTRKVDLKSIPLEEKKKLLSAFKEMKATVGGRKLAGRKTNKEKNVK